MSDERCDEISQDVRRVDYRCDDLESRIANLEDALKKQQFANEELQNLLGIVMRYETSHSDREKARDQLWDAISETINGCNAKRFFRGKDSDY